MKTTIHKSNTRGFKDIGWLKSNHTFSFSDYYNPERIHFGALRVINDDYVEAGMGFGTHPHSNMEIISIPIEGDLEHKDSMGNVAQIHKGDIQVLSAGTGITHSEYNKNNDEAVKFFQIWVIPNKHGVEPRYDQKSINDLSKEGEFYQILSPNPDDEGVWIHQDAWFHMGDLKSGQSINYNLKNPNNGVYALVIKGSAKIGDTVLEEKDGLQVENVSSFDVVASKETKVLLMEIPMIKL